MSEPDKHPGGRPTKYKPEFAAQAEKLCQLGATDADLASFFGVTNVTVWRWQAEYPEFCNAIKAGKAPADDRVERSLFHKAVGYSFNSEKVFQHQGEIVRAKTIEHVPPDTTAMIFWLKNRRPAEWRDKHEVEHTHRLADLSDDELIRIAAGSGAGTPAQTSGKAVAH